MAEPAGQWRPTTLGLINRHVGRRIRLTVQVPSVEEGQHFEGLLTASEPSDVSTVYQAVTFTEDDGHARTLDLPLGHAIDVLVAAPVEPKPLDDVAAAELVAEAVRRYEVDPRFHARARLAARLSELTEYSDLEGAVLVGAVLGLVVDDHPELIP